MSGAALKFHGVIRSFDIPARLPVRSISSGIFFHAFRAVQLKQKRARAPDKYARHQESAVATRYSRCFDIFVVGVQKKKEKEKTKENRLLTLPWVKTIVGRKVRRFASGYYANGEQCAVRRVQMQKNKKENKHRRGEGERERERERESRVERNARAFESINLTAIEFIGNYFSRAYGPFASIEDENEGEVPARGV